MKETTQGYNKQKEAQYFETVIIGTGFSGLLAAVSLQKKNILLIF
jgi:cation diffusion facilitator CzcD-associated flavoprotein CzcO